MRAAMPYFQPSKIRRNTRSTPTLGMSSPFRATFTRRKWSRDGSNSIVFWTKMVRMPYRINLWGAHYDISESVATGDGGNQVMRENEQLQTKDKTPSMLQETAPSGDFLVDTPPASQSTVSTSLSRQSTEPAIDTASSTSTSSSSSSTSFSSISSGSGDIGDQKLGRIMAAVQEIVGECRICWIQRDTTKHPHRTFRCSTGICSGNNWRRFKVGLQFPKNVVC